MSQANARNGVLEQIGHKTEAEITDDNCIKLLHSLPNGLNVIKTQSFMFMSGDCHITNSVNGTTNTKGFTCRYTYDV